MRMMRVVGPWLCCVACVPERTTGGNSPVVVSSSSAGSSSASPASGSASGGVASSSASGPATSVTAGSSGSGASSASAGPAAPQVGEPAAMSTVFSPVAVEVYVEVLAQVRATLVRASDGAVLANNLAAASGWGTARFDLAYPDEPAGTALRLEVVQMTVGGTSPAAVVQGDRILAWELERGAAFRRAVSRGKGVWL